MSRYGNERKDKLYDELEYNYAMFLQETAGLGFLDWLSMLMEILTDFIRNNSDE